MIRECPKKSWMSRSIILTLINPVIQHLTHKVKPCQEQVWLVTGRLPASSFFLCFRPEIAIWRYLARESDMTSKATSQQQKLTLHHLMRTAVCKYACMYVAYVGMYNMFMGMSVCMFGMSIAYANMFPAV